MHSSSVRGVALTAFIGAAAFLACGDGLIIPSGAATVSAAFGTCDVVNGYAAVSASYCEGVVTCPGAYYAICDGTAWSACDCSGAWLKDGTYSEIKKPDFGVAPGGGDGGGGSEGGGAGDGSYHLVPVPVDGGSVSPGSEAGGGEGSIGLSDAGSVVPGGG